MDPFTWVTFARKDHPARDNWYLQAWRTYPHLMVNLTRSLRNPFPETGGSGIGGRRVTTMVGDSAGIASILAKTDLLAAYPAALLAWDMEAHGLCALKPPVDLVSVLVRFFWSSRLANDAASVWIRSIVIESYRRLNAEAELKLAIAT
jgi:hypothetical protein